MPAPSASSFPGDVLARFLPLLSEFGFAPSEEDDDSVRFDGPGVFVGIAFDGGRSRELAVWIGRIDDPEHPLELADVVRATDCPPETLDDVQLMQARDSEVLGHLLDRALAVLDTCGRDFLRGDPDAFARAKALRSARSVEANRQARTGPHVVDADRAWERKDYRTVHALLEPIRKDLDATHRRRLDFAARRL